MALTINTNISSLIAQRNLELATSALNTSIERMTTGFKINHAGDNAAGHSIATLWKTHIGSLDVASDNAAMGADLLTTAEESYSLLIDHIQRVRDLTEQAANGTYGTNSLKAIRSEIEARLSEVERIVNNTEFNGIKLLNGTAGEIKLQVGLYNNDYSQITLVESLFDDAGLAELFQSIGGFTGDDAESIAQECSGLASDNVTISAQAPKLDCLDKILANLSERVTGLGAAQNRVSSAITSIEVQSRNLTSSLSTLRDADIAEESSNYIQAQILQQAASTLLSTANQAPSIALNLI